MARARCIDLAAIAAMLWASFSVGAEMQPGLNGDTVEATWIRCFYVNFRGWRFYQRMPEPGAKPPDYDPCSGVWDATISAANPNHNAGREPILEISGSGSGNERAALIRFDVADIPADTPIKAAQLWLYFIGRRGTQSGATTVNVFQVNRPWTEGEGQSGEPAGGEGRRARTGEATWRAGGQGLNRWGEPGCRAVPDDRERDPVASLTIGPTDPEGVWKSWDVTPLVRLWIAQPDENRGLLLCEAETGASDPCVLQFCSSEASRRQSDRFGAGSRAALRPVLVVIPEPGQ